jgi:hypothetical protein
MFIGMKYLNDIQTVVIPTEEGYNVIYSMGEYSGTVSYIRYEMDNLLMRNKPVFLMTTCDMGDIIEVIHQRTPLSSNDFNDLNMEIRNHSKEILLKNILP